MYIEISNPMDYHVGLYIRLSKEDETEGPSGSVTNQKSLLDDFVKKHRLSVFDTYIDDGWSGTSFDRPDFKRMINDIEEKKVNMVITKDLSRLGRDYIMTGHYMERYFPEKQVRYISLLDGIDTGVDSTANDITPFRAIMNDMYAKDISKKIKSVKHNKQRKGQFIGGKAPYGYKLDPEVKNKLIIDEEAAKIVRYIFSRALTGISCRQIAIDLNEKGIPTPAQYAGLTISNPGPYSGKWSSERVTDMLKNETYLGNMVQGRMIKINYKTKKCLRTPKEDWIIVENTHESLVDKEAFNKVQELIKSRSHTRSRTYDFLLKGLIYCHECGYPLGVVNRKLISGKSSLILICRTYQRFTRAGACSSHTIKEETVTNAVIEKVKEVCEAYINPDEMISLATFALENKKNGFDELKVTKNRIDTLTSNLDKMYIDKLNGLLSEEDFERIYNNLKAEKIVLEEKTAELQKKIDNPSSNEKRAKELVKAFMASYYTNRELLISLIDRIELTEDKKIIIKFKFKQLEQIK